MEKLQEMVEKELEFYRTMWERYKKRHLEYVANHYYAKIITLQDVLQWIDEIREDEGK